MLIDEIIYPIKYIFCFSYKTKKRRNSRHVQRWSQRTFCKIYQLVVCVQKSASAAVLEQHLLHFIYQLMTLRRHLISSSQQIKHLNCYVDFMKLWPKESRVRLANGATVTWPHRRGSEKGKGKRCDRLSRDGLQKRMLRVC